MDSVYYLALNLAMVFLPALKSRCRNFDFWAISVICLSYIFFCNLFKTALCLAHWSCSWLADFVNLRWLCWKKRCECLQLSSKVSSSGNFHSHINPWHRLAYLELCSTLYYSILRSSFHWGTMQSLWDWSVSIVPLKKAMRATLYFTSIEVYAQTFQSIGLLFFFLEGHGNH